MSTSGFVTLYDLDSPVEPKGFSPHTWRTRLDLNFKRIPYKTQWLAFPDISSTLEKVGVPPIGVKADGTPIYCCPSITAQLPTGSEDHLTDSGPIAEYLDANFDGPKLFAPGSKAAQHLLISHINDHLLWNLGRLLVPITGIILDPRSREHYERSG